MIREPFSSLIVLRQHLNLNSQKICRLEPLDYPREQAIEALSESLVDLGPG